MGKRIALFVVVSLFFLGCQKQQEVEIVEEVEVEEVEVVEEEVIPEPTPEEIVAQLQMVYFDFDKYNVREGDATTLEENSKILKEHADIKVVVEGHCDERGTHEYNLLLGERRANATKKYLVQLEVNADNLSTVSYGKEKPLDPGQGEECWAKNRRAQFTLKQ